MGMIRHPEDFNPNTVVILQGNINKIHENVTEEHYLGSYEKFCTVKNKSWDIKIHFKATIFENVDPKTMSNYPFDVINHFEIVSVVLEGESMNTFLVAYGLLDGYLSDELYEIEQKFTYDSILMFETEN